MLKWFHGPLMDKDPAPGGGSDTILIDPGTPFEHGQEPEPLVKRIEKSAAELENETLKADLVKAKAKADQHEEDARFWARRANAKPEVVEREEPESRPAPITNAEKPEKLLDDLSSEGLDALKKRGFITQEQLLDVIARQEKKTESAIATARSDAEFGGRIAAEFPEIAEDSRRVDRGEKPQSELFKRAGEIYRAAVSDDPALSGSKGLLLIAARQAKAELDAQAKPVKKEKEAPVDDPTPHDRQQRRRERIAAQTPERARSADESSSEPSFDKQQLEVMKHLGVKSDEFVRHSGVSRNGR